MRARFHLIVAFALLLAAPAAALAQTPIVTPYCPIPPAGTWSPQEKFVWARICGEDEVADLAKQPGAEEARCPTTAC